MQISSTISQDFQRLLLTRLGAFLSLLLLQEYLSGAQFRLLSLSALLAHYFFHFVYYRNSKAMDNGLVGFSILIAIVLFVLMPRWFMLFYFGIHTTFNDVYLSIGDRSRSYFSSSLIQIFFRLIFNGSCYLKCIRYLELPVSDPFAHGILNVVIGVSFFGLFFSTRNEEREKYLIFDALWVLPLMYGQVRELTLDSMVFYHVLFWILHPVIFQSRYVKQHLIQQTAGILFLYVTVPIFPVMKLWGYSVGYWHATLVFMVSQWNPLFLRNLFQRKAIRRIQNYGFDGQI